MKKRLISLLLVFAMVLTMLPATALAAPANEGTSADTVNPFTDVKEGDWCYDAVQYARMNGFFNGTTKTTFDPNGTMTRGMFVTVLGRMAGVDTEAYKGKSSFKDVPATKYYAPYVAWAAKHGITTGTSEDTFNPNGLINRQQMAAFFVRYFEAFGVDYETGANITTIPADLANVSSYAKDAVLKLWKQGLLNGDGTNFNPKGNATRAHAATLTMRADQAVETWYKEPGVPSDRVRIDPATGKPVGSETPVKPSKPDTPAVKPSKPSNPNSDTYEVRFYDGSRLIDTLYATKDEPLGELPSVEKSSKANAILLGYFTNPECTKPFYAEEPVTGNMDVYAKYEDMGEQEVVTFTSFAEMDQSPDLSFVISGSGDPRKAVTLEVKDGSDPVELAFEPVSGGYKVYAPKGFNEGSSYQLHLADGWTFTGKADTIRTASFSIYKEQVENMQMSDDIIYIKDTGAISYTVSGKAHDVLTPSLVTAAGGSFSYAEADELDAGDIICVYVDKHPDQRSTKGSDTLLPAVYVKVSSVSGNKVTFEQLGAEDQQKLYEVPDNFPIIVGELPTAASGSVNINTLDLDMYATMMGEGYDLAKAKESIAKGDFVTLYVSQDGIESEEDLYYAEITKYDESTGEITYQQTTREAILESMDLYADADVSADDLITEEEKAEMEAALLEQVEESGFAEEAAFVLADMISKTDAFRDTRGIQNWVITDAEGNELSDEEIALLNLGGSFELSDGIKLTVELITEGDQLHYGDGVQIAVGIDAEFEVELNDDDDKLAINLSATFAQEVALDPRVKGKLVYKEILWIPIPVGVSVGATIDVKSFTAFSFEAEILTVAAEDEALWDQFMDVVNNPEKLADLDFLPADLSKGLKNVGDVFDKIEELEGMAAKAKENTEQYLGYVEDINMLWDVIEENGLTTKEDYEIMCEALDRTSITSDLLAMMDMTNKTELETEYYESMEALMERYCEMLEQESDWVKLVEQEIYTYEQFYYGIAVGVEISFVVRADLSLAIGSNLQYEVGKRYEFWFKIGLFKPTAGSSTMDLLDERFAFQFYVMGRLGLKAGIKAEIYVALGTGDLAKIGIATELGPYIKIYGFFIYEYEKFRAANTSNWVSDERMAGAMFLEFGLYLIVSFEASALSDLFSYSYDFVDEEFPLLTAGTKRFYYQPDYEPMEGEIVLVADVDKNSTNGITMTLPTYLLGLRFLELPTGLMAVEALDYKNYHYAVSNPNFSINPNTGEISVTVPEGQRYMECDLTVTYKYSKMAFSTFDMTVTVPLVWTNMATDDLAQYYTAAVRVGNNADGYETIWTKRVLKNKAFDLPSAEEIMELLNWNEYKHVLSGGYGSQQLEGLTLIEDEVYDFNIDYKTYSITVDGVQKANGSTGSKTFYADYGETFDFSALENTGTTDYDAGVFTKFAGVTAPAGIDLSKAIDSRMAAALESGVTATAEYVDNSVTAIFSFTGIDAEDVTMTLCKGDTPSLDAVEALAAEHDAVIKDIFPAVAAMTASGSYQVICETQTEEVKSVTIFFEEKGGSEVKDITKPIGSVIGALPVPEKSGYRFDGWYSDEALTEPFELTNMSETDITLYAKWSAVGYAVTFHVNGGNAWTGDDGYEWTEGRTGEKAFTYGEPYGTLPEPSRTGYGFVGWFTAAEGGEQVKAEDPYTLTEGQTLYAHWVELKEIPKTVFDFGEVENFIYEREVTHAAAYTFTAEEGETYTEGSFKIEYIAEGYEGEGYLPAANEAGIYGVKITRPADNVYAKVEHFYEAVLTIEKATRELNHTPEVIVTNEKGFTYLNMRVADGTIYDLHPDAKIVYTVDEKNGETVTANSGSVATSSSASEIVRVEGLAAGTTFAVKIGVIGDRNYHDVTAPVYSNHDNAVTKAVPATTWDSDSNNYYTSWYTEHEDEDEYIITLAEELAGLAYLVNNGTTNFAGKTVKLDADIDLSAHEWVPIGTNQNFSGSFDGQNHTITGMACVASSMYCGLFGKVYAGLGETCTIENVVIKDSYIRGKQSLACYIGGIVGQLMSTYGSAVINNCVSYAVISGVEGFQPIAGGIVGTMAAGVVSNCTNYGTVKGRVADGICGSKDGYSTVENCVNHGTVVKLS